MGAERALNVVGLQALLMSAVRDYRDRAGVAQQAPQVLATAAALDYVLMLATDTAHAQIPAAEAHQAMRDGLARAIDDALLLLGTLAAANDAPARAFVRDGVRTVRSVIDAEGLADDRRSFALIALAADVAT